MAMGESVKKVAIRHFFEFYGFCLSHSLPGGKTERYENLKVFIRSDVHAVRVGIKLKGQPPLNNPRVFRQLAFILSISRF